ncbi:hypothetical protein BT69DRAFT_576835 [Atractiella rhizophila]|nr:hypothetical protein BT69DRAFT_576835 [Atractiella rhizophila]
MRSPLRNTPGSSMIGGSSNGGGRWDVGLDVSGSEGGFDVGGVEEVDASSERRSSISNDTSLPFSLLLSFPFIDTPPCKRASADPASSPIPLPAFTSIPSFDESSLDSSTFATAGCKFGLPASWVCPFVTLRALIRCALVDASGLRLTAEGITSIGGLRMVRVGVRGSDWEWAWGGCEGRRGEGEGGGEKVRNSLGAFMAPRTTTSCGVPSPNQ